MSQAGRKSDNGASDLERFGVSPSRYSSGDLELRLRGQVRFFRAVLKELKSRQGLPLKKRFSAWRRGFSSQAWILYGLEKNDPGQYFSDISTRLGVYRINGFFNPIIDNKLVFSRLASEHEIPHPGVVSVITEGRLHAEAEASGSTLTDLLASTLEGHPRQVFRPTWSGGGGGVFFLDKKQHGLELNGNKVTLEEVSDLLSGLDRYLATDFTEQATYARTVFPRSTNTLRILTLWDYQTDQPFIAAVAHRFGTSRSAPLDNWHGGKGGVCASVDCDSSTLGRAARTTDDLALDWCSSHPDTGEPIEGVVIPGLATCLQGVLAAARHFPFCPLIGWDVVVTENGFSVLEANPQPAFRAWQVHHPLLADERTKAFFRHWNLAG